MKKEVSIYLDVVRFLAAMAVFVSHFSLHRLSGGFLWQAGPYGHEAVTVFFVLSGFVIAYATDTRETTASSYCISRMARMYSVAVPAVLLTALLDELGSHMRPDLYGAAWGYAQDLSFTRFFTALSFTNELWTLSIRQGSNAAYWSMGYEVPYYLIFGLALFTPAHWRIAAVALALLAVGPSIVASLPIWLLGVAAYRYCKHSRLSPRTGVLMFAGSLLAWIVYEVVATRWGRPMIEGNAFFKRHEMVQDYIVAAFFVVNMVGFNAASARLGAPLMKISGTVRWLAGTTFTLYLCHLPLAQFLLACMPWPPADPRSRVLVFFGTLAAVFLLAEFTEKRKTAWRVGIEALWNRLSPSSRSTALPRLPGHHD